MPETRGNNLVGPPINGENGNVTAFLDRGRILEESNATNGQAQIGHHSRLLGLSVPNFSKQQW